MNTRSLRLRLMVAATGAILLALAIAGFGLVLLFERHVERRIGSELNTYLNQIAARTVFGDDGAARLGGKLADPRFDQVYAASTGRSQMRRQASSRARALCGTLVLICLRIPHLSASSMCTT